MKLIIQICSILMLCSFFTTAQVRGRGANDLVKIKNCLNVPLDNTSGTWKLTKGNYDGVSLAGSPRSAYWDGGFVGICTDKPIFPLHVNSTAKINNLIVNKIDGRMFNEHLSIAANKGPKNGAEIQLYGNTHQAGKGRINFISGDRQGYGFVFTNYMGGNYNNLLVIRNSGKVSIGPVHTTGDYRLFVKDGILTERIKIAQSGTNKWADFVFEDNYILPPLEMVEHFIKENKHLPDIPSEKEVKENGIDVAEMDAKLLQKIEELTLYLIEQDKKIKKLEKHNQSLSNSIAELANKKEKQ